MLSLENQLKNLLALIILHRAQFKLYEAPIFKTNQGKIGFGCRPRRKTDNAFLQNLLRPFVNSQRLRTYYEMGNFFLVVPPLQHYRKRSSDCGVEAVAFSCLFIWTRTFID